MLDESQMRQYEIRLWELNFWRLLSLWIEVVAEVQKFVEVTVVLEDEVHSYFEVGDEIQKLISSWIQNVVAKKQAN